MSSSRLFYYGTEDEVELGDRVRIKRWLRADLTGVVCYIPGISPVHAELEYSGVKQWAIRCDDGTVRPMGYAPESPYGQPSETIVFLGRGTGESLNPDEVLE